MNSCADHRTRASRCSHASSARLGASERVALSSAVPIRLPLVGLRFAVSTIAPSTGPETGRGPGSVRRLASGRSPGRDLHRARHDRELAPGGTSSRDAATPSFTPSPAMLPPRSRARRSCASARSSWATRLRSPRSGQRSSLPARASWPPSSSSSRQGVVEGLGYLVLAADFLHGAVSAQAGEHDLELLLGCELAVIASGSQLDLLGR